MEWNYIMDILSKVNSLNNTLPFYDLSKGVSLDNSNLYDVHLHSEYNELNNLRDYLFNFLSDNNDQFVKKNKTKNKAQIKNLIINLFKAFNEDPSKYVAIHLGKPYYTSIRSRYNELHIKTILIAAVHLLAEHKYIELHTGFFDKSSRIGRISRIRASNKLIKLFAKRNLHSHMIQRSKNIELIIMKDAVNKNEIDYEDNDETIKMREDLKKYNELLARTYVDIPMYSERGVRVKIKKNDDEYKYISINQTEKVIKRVFNNNSWEDGGRFYGGWWQRIPSYERQHIHFFNIPSSEIDYSGLHIKLLYLQYDHDLKEDPYTIPGIEQNEMNRRIIKLCMLNLINAKDENLALKAIQNEINFDIDLYGYFKKNKIQLKQFTQLMKKHHEKIKNSFGTGAGIKLQKFDAMIAEEIINHFTNLDIPVLCIHDSFIISADKTEELDKVMQEKFNDVLFKLNYQPKGSKVKLKGLGKAEFKAWLSRPEYRDIMINNIIKLKYEYPIWYEKMQFFKKHYKKSYI